MRRRSRSTNRDSSGTYAAAASRQTQIQAHTGLDPLRRVHVQIDGTRAADMFARSAGQRLPASARASAVCRQDARVFLLRRYVRGVPRISGVLGTSICPALARATQCQNLPLRFRCGSTRHWGISRSPVTQLPPLANRLGLTWFVSPTRRLQAVP